MVIKPKIIVGAIALAFGAVSFALSFFADGSLPAGICGLIAGILGLACGLDWSHEEASAGGSSSADGSSAASSGRGERVRMRVGACRRVRTGGVGR